MASPLDITGQTHNPSRRSTVAPVLVPVKMLNAAGTLPADNNLQFQHLSGKQEGALVLFKDQSGKYSLRTATGSGKTNLWVPVNESDAEDNHHMPHYRVNDPAVTITKTGEWFWVDMGNTVHCVQNPVLDANGALKYIISLTQEGNVTMSPEGDSTDAIARFGVSIGAASPAGIFLSSSASCNSFDTGFEELDTKMVVDVAKHNPRNFGIRLYHSRASHITYTFNVVWLQDQPLFS